MHYTQFEMKINFSSSLIKISKFHRKSDQFAIEFHMAEKKIEWTTRTRLIFSNFSLNLDWFRPSFLKTNFFFLNLIPISITSRPNRIETDRIVSPTHQTN